MGIEYWTFTGVPRCDPGYIRMASLW